MTKWTRIPPTEPGYWWIWRDRDLHPRVCLLEFREYIDGGGRLVTKLIGHSYDVAECGAHMRFWPIPIPPPKEDQ